MRNSSGGRVSGRSEWIGPFFVLYYEVLPFDRVCGKAACVEFTMEFLPSMVGISGTVIHRCRMNGGSVRVAVDHAVSGAYLMLDGIVVK